MSTGTTKSPNLPVAPLEYDRLYFEQLTNVLRLYFSQLDNPGFSAASGLNLLHCVLEMYIGILLPVML